MYGRVRIGFGSTATGSRASGRVGTARSILGLWFPSAASADALGLRSPGSDPRRLNRARDDRNRVSRPHPAHAPRSPRKRSRHGGRPRTPAWSKKIAATGEGAALRLYLLSIIGERPGHFDAVLALVDHDGLALHADGAELALLPVGGGGRMQGWVRQPSICSSASRKAWSTRSRKPT